MRVLDQDRPVLRTRDLPLNDVLAPVAHLRPHDAAAKGVGAGVDRVLHDVTDPAVGRTGPAHLAPCAAMRPGRQLDPLVEKPQHHLPQALKLVEPAEHQLQDQADPLVRILLDPLLVDAHVARRNRREQCTPLGLAKLALHHPAPDVGRLKLAHRALNSEHEAVGRNPGVVDRLLVGQEAADKGAVVDQPVPLHSVPREPGRVHRQDDADFAPAHRPEHAVEARTHAAAAGTTEILVDHHRLRPSQGPGSVSQAILPLPASGIAEDLLHGGLADIDDRFAGNVISRDPAHLAPPSHPEPGRSPPA